MKNLFKVAIATLATAVALTIPAFATGTNASDNNAYIARIEAKAAESEAKLVTEAQAKLAYRNQVAELQAKLDALTVAQNELTAEVRTFNSSIEMMEAAMSEMEAAGCEIDPMNPMGWVDWIPMHQQADGYLAAGLMWCMNDALRGSANAYAYAGTYYGAQMHVYSSYDDVDMVYADNNFDVARKGSDIIVVLEGNHYSVSLYTKGENACAVSSGWTSVQGYPLLDTEKHGQLGWIAEFFCGAFVAVEENGQLRAKLMLGNAAPAPVAQQPQVQVQYVDRVVEKPVEVIKTVEVEKPVEVIKTVEVEKPVEVIKTVEVEKPVEVIKTVEVEKPIEVIKTVEVEKPVEVIKTVEVEKPVEVIKTVEVEKPVEVIKTVEVEKPVEVIKTVEVPVEVEKVVYVEVPAPAHNTQPDLGFEDTPVDDINDDWAPVDVIDDTWNPVNNTETATAHNTQPELGFETTSVNDNWEAETTSDNDNDNWDNSNVNTDTSVNDNWEASYTVETNVEVECETESTVNDEWNSTAHNTLDDLGF